MHAERGEPQAEQAAQTAEKQAFDEKLADDSPARCAQRGADGHFALAAESAAQHHVGDIGAGNDQHEPDRGKHQQKDDTDAAAVKAFMECRTLAPMSLSTVGVLAGEASGDTVELGAGVLARLRRA